MAGLPVSDVLLMECIKALATIKIVYTLFFVIICRYMKRKLQPWNLRSTDLFKPGLHAEPTLAYELMFEFLRLSPSYELAKKASEGLLTEEEKVRLPKDFDQVMATYRLLGDVQRILFRKWWIKYGLKVFGNPHNKPKVHKLDTLKGGVDIDSKEVSPSLKEYLLDTRKSEGLVESVLIALPVQLKRAEWIKQISAIIDELRSESNPSQSQPILKLYGKRLRKKELMSGLRLLWFRAAKPKWEYWRLGAYSKFSKTYSQALDPKGARKTTSTLESVDREMMTKITGRALRKFEFIAENAARGRFPCAEPVEIIDFDYLALVKRIKTKNAWELKEKERLREIWLSKSSTN